MASYLPVHTSTAGRSWWKPLLGLLLSISAAAVCAVLSAEHLAARPANLRDHTITLVAAIENILNQEIGEQAWHRTATILRESEKASWLQYTIAAREVPPDKAENVTRRLQQAMPSLSVTVTVQPPRDRIQELGFVFQECEFAQLRIETARADYSSKCAGITAAIIAHLVKAGIPQEEIQEEREPRQDERSAWTYTRIAAPAYKGIVAAEFASSLQDALAIPGTRVNARIGINGVLPFSMMIDEMPCAEIELAKLDETDINGKSQPQNGRLTLPETLLLDSTGVDDATSAPETPETPPAQTQKPRVAIIVDDGGYGGPTNTAFLAMDTHLTLAIMPGGTYAAEIAEKAVEAGFEVILHLPMQHELGREWLNMDMSLEQIREKTEQAIAKVPGIVGINSHMGSLFTADQQAVDKFISVIKNHPFYFIDSRTTAKSKILAAARNAGIRAASRDVFLDNEPDPEYIRKQFEQLMSLAEKRGKAIGICHFRKNTAKIMPELLPLLEQNGIELVHASELVH